MKARIFLALIITMFACAVNAQLRKMPSSVTDAFANRYPHAEEVSWSDKLTSFEATFKLNGFDMKSDFSSGGEWKSTQKKLVFDDLPSEVKDGFSKSEFSSWSTGSVTEIQQPGGGLQYKLYAEKSSPFQKKFLYFDAGGKLLRDVITL